MDSINQDPATIMKRLEHLERENRCLKRLCLTAFLGIGAFMLMGQVLPSTGKKTVEAEAIHLRDSEGRGRVLMTVDDEGPSLRFFDKDGKGRLVIRTTQSQGPEVALYHNEGKARTVLSVNPEGIPSLFILDNEARSSASIAIDPQGGTAIRLLDAAFNARATLSMSSEGGAGLGLMDKNNKGGVLLGVGGKNDENSLYLSDKDGNVRARLKISGDGLPALQLHDVAGVQRVNISTVHIGKSPDTSPVLALFDKNGGLGVALGIDPTGEGSLALRDKYGRVK
jgi:hypothetical protein